MSITTTNSFVDVVSFHHSRDAVKHIFRPASELTSSDVLEGRETDFACSLSKTWMVISPLNGKPSVEMITNSVKGYVATATLVGCLSLIFSTVRSFHVSPTKCFNRERVKINLQPRDECDRRRFLVGAAFSSVVYGPIISRADEDQDLTSQLFNPDGSLKEGVTTEVAKPKIVEFKWDPSDALLINLDGENTEKTPSGTQVRISYELPDKWGTGNELYLDKSEGANVPACERITVYKAPLKATMDRLERATTIGVGKALEVTDELAKLRTADIIGGRKEVKGNQKYYQFDMASAPDTCDKSKDNLGLGFCPYDTIYLLSATTLDERLYVMAVECNNLEWKQGNADLKRVRSSFSVQAVA